MSPTIAFGIDLAGYTTRKSVSAAAVASSGSAEVTILQQCPFAKERQVTDELASVATEEINFLRKLLAIGRVAVDIPIDLQGLPDPTDVTQIWQLTLRPIDYALGAMPALADRIGAPTARFRNIVRQGEFEPELGRRLFETYPAGTLRQLHLPFKGYKGDKPEARRRREGIQDKLKIASDLLCDDELDAAICALTALVEPDDRLEGSDLVEYANKTARDQVDPAATPPRGYLLLRNNPFSSIAVTRMPADEFHGRVK